MSNNKFSFRAVFIFLVLFPLGCTTVKYYPVNFVDSLKHPTKFPEVFTFTVQNIEEIAEKNPLGENETEKFTDIAENKNSSMHLVQIRENAELHPHYHKRHDEVIYVKKGSGIATLDGTRYMIKPGSMLQIPSKTVHKFLNTGGETFMAVSIFSPPFDGRDEKTIKEKRRVDRGTKEIKRLAAKKPEKVIENNEPVAVKKAEEGDIQPNTDKPLKVAEKRLNKPFNEGLDTATEIEKSSLSAKKLSHPEGKKKSKIVNHDEETEPLNPVKIEELHEKISKLLALKEEGTISDEEYEEKKDALVKGKDIGELPELKGYAKKQIPIEPLEEEPFLKQEEKDTTFDTNVTDQNQDTTLNTPSFYRDSEGETKEPGAEAESEGEESPSEDKLRMLEEMKQEGLITEEDYETKRKELFGSSEEETVQPASETIVSDDKMKELKELYDEGLITKEDYENKKEGLISATEETTVETSSGNSFSDNSFRDERIEELKELYHEGLITEDDYMFKIKELTETQKKDFSPDTSTEKGVENEKLSELAELKEQGLISEEDYEFKKSQLMGN